jgi:hypothetical protein
VSRFVFNGDIGCIPAYETWRQPNMKAIFKLVIATLAFLLFVYSTTVAMSLMYELDAAFLGF